MLVQTALSGKIFSTLRVRADCLRVFSLVSVVHTLDMLRQVRVAAKHFLADSALQCLFTRDPVAVVYCLDVVPEVRHVRADSWTLGAPDLGGGGGDG